MLLIRANEKLSIQSCHEKGRVEWSWPLISTKRTLAGRASLRRLQTHVHLGRFQADAVNAIQNAKYHLGIA